MNGSMPEVEINSSSSLNIIEPTPVIPGLELYISSPISLGYASKCFLTVGLGHTIIMSPLITFSI